MKLEEILRRRLNEGSSFITGFEAIEAIERLEQLQAELKQTKAEFKDRNKVYFKAMEDKKQLTAELAEAKAEINNLKAQLDGRAGTKYVKKICDKLAQSEANGGE